MIKGKSYGLPLDFAVVGRIINGTVQVFLYTKSGYISPILDSHNKTILTHM